MFTKNTFVWCILASVLLSLAASQDENAAAEQEAAAEAMPEPLDGIETFSVFPHVADNRFPIGEQHELLVGVKNKADVAINITFIAGSLRSPFDQDYYIQNLTSMEVGMVVSPGESVSLLYRYAPYASLDPVVYTLATMMVYHTQEQYHISPLYNKTIELYEPASQLDAKSLFANLIIYGIAAALAFFLFNLTNPQPAKKLRKEKKVEKGEEKSNKNEWIRAATTRRSTGKKLRK